MTYEVSLSVAGGPSVSEDNHFEAGAIDKIEVAIPFGGAPNTVNVPAVGTVHAILITCDDYVNVSFTVDEGLTSIDLKGPILLIGSTINILGITAGDFIFTNMDDDTDANVTILVARDA